MAKLIVYLKECTLEDVLKLKAQIEQSKIVAEVAHQADGIVYGAGGPTIIKDFPMRDAYPIGYKK